jgi:hypothetical protein
LLGVRCQAELEMMSRKCYERSMGTTTGSGVITVTALVKIGKNQKQ